MMDPDFIILSDGPLTLTLCRPGTFYRGTRFDWCGVFRSIACGGVNFSDLWFDGSDPLRHDNLTGCSEVFSPVWIDSTHCVKVGVGVLEVPEGRDEYDRFKLYRIVDPGRFEVVSDGLEARFVHRLDGFYEYEKVVSVKGTRFSIAHTLRWTPDGRAGGSSAATILCYNHNFFTFGRDVVGPSRSIVFGSAPTGDWRPDSVSGYIDGNALRFSRDMKPGEKCFIGNLFLPCEAGLPYKFSMRDCRSGCGASVEVSCDVPMSHAVFWSNHRVACLEPHVSIPLVPGSAFSFTIDYSLVAGPVAKTPGNAQGPTTPKILLQL